MATTVTATKQPDNSFAVDSGQLDAQTAADQAQIDALYGQVQKSEAALGKSEQQMQDLAGAEARSEATSQPPTPPKQQGNLLDRLAPLLLISAFGGHASKLDASAMLGATIGTVKGFLAGNAEEYAKQTAAYNLAYKRWEQRQAQMEKVYKDYLDAYKGRVDYQEKALEAMLKTMGEANTNRRMDLQIKARMDQARATLARSNQQEQDTQAYRKAMIALEEKRLLGASLNTVQQNPVGSAGFMQLAKDIAHYRRPMITLSSFALRYPGTRGWYQALNSAVDKVNPSYNAANFDRAKRAREQFASGKLGDRVNSLDTFTQHLQVLESLAGALATGDVRSLNAAKLAWERQIGSTPPTNFAAARRAVADEVVSAWVPGVGSIQDRDAAEQNLSGASSPQQLAGVIQTYERLAGGKIAALAIQYNHAVGAQTFVQDVGLTPMAAQWMNAALEQEGLKPLPTSDALEPRGAAPAPQTHGAVVRTGTYNGRKVVQYADGTIQYVQ